MTLLFFFLKSENSISITLPYEIHKLFSISLSVLIFNQSIGIKITIYGNQVMMQRCSCNVLPDSIYLISINGLTFQENSDI